MPCLKSVQWSFHQGNIKFGETAGKQCTCCSLFSVAFTLVKTPGYWDRKDLDFILENGNRIYKGLNTNRYLMVPELPRQILLFESQIVQVEFKTNKFGFLNSQSVPGSLLDFQKIWSLKFVKSDFVLSDKVYMFIDLININAISIIHNTQETKKHKKQCINKHLPCSKKTHKTKTIKIMLFAAVILYEYVVSVKSV